MSVRAKLLIIILFVALVPLGISAISTLRTHREAFEAKTSQLHTRTAEYGAAAADQYFESAQRSLALVVHSIQWAELSQAEVNGAVWLAYRQLDDIAAASLLDANGDGIGPSAFVEPTSGHEDFRNHPTVTLEDLKAFAGQIPLAKAQNEKSAVGEIFAGAGRSGPMLPLAFRVSGPNNWVFAAALSLRGVCEQLEGLGSKDVSVYLVDPSGRTVCGPAAPPARAGSTAEVPGKGQGVAVRFEDPVRGELLASVAQTSRGWRVIVEQPARSAFASSRQLLTQTLFWLALGLLISVVAGLFLAQSINRPVRRLLDAALELAKGRFDRPVEIDSRDELGQLSEAFNQMVAEIRRRDSEIRAWNETLQARVDERTRELRDAQDQLLQSQKIAAVTGLAAGIAHEINNPLAGVIGLTQVLLNRLREDSKNMPLLADVEKEALRIKGIVSTLVTLGQDCAGGHSTLNVNEVIDAALAVVQSEKAGASIEVVRLYEPDLPPVLGNRAQLQQVFLHIMNNARQAMSHRGGSLTVSTSIVDGKLIKIAMKDTGRGISPDHLDLIFEPFFTTKENWTGEGLGLTVAFKLVEQHQGKLKADSELGRGTTMTITLPAARRGTHLA
jgi:two-component system NtrC family sensor kinase